MKTFPRYIRIFLIVITVVLGGIMALNSYIDPLQHFRKATYPALLVKEGRYRLPGLARHSATELIATGTSVTKMQLPAEMKRIFGLDALNLSMDGASAHEQFLLLRLALRTGRVKEVIWDVNFEYLRGTPKWVSDYDGAFPAYLFDDSKANDLSSYLLSIDITKHSAKILARKYPIVTVESYQQLPKDFTTAPESMEKAIARRLKGLEKFRALIPEFTDENLRENFRQNFAALIREFPNVRFRLYFPPFSAAYVKFIRQHAPELIPPFLNSRAAVLKEVAALPNVELHDIQSDIPLISDLTHYADPIHFDRAYYTRVLEIIHAGTHRANEHRLAEFSRFVNAEQTRP